MRLALQQTITASWCAHYLQSRKVLVSVVWTTSSVARSHWTRHRPTAAAGRLHTITSRELGPVAHARPPSMAYAPLSPYDRPLPCHQTRPANSNSTLRSFASGSEIGKGCALCNPTILLLLSDPHTACYLVSYTPSSLDRQDTKHTLLHIKHQHSHSDGNRSFIPRSLACMHFGALYPALYCFWASNSNSLSQSSNTLQTLHINV